MQLETRPLLRSVVVQRPGATTPTRPSIGPATPDWEQIRARAAATPWAGAIVDAVRTDAEHWRPRLALPGPHEPSAWTHHYYCDDDGAKLVFDLQSPTAHPCPECGRVYTDEIKAGAWRTQMHNLVAAQAQREALVIRCHDGAADTAAAVDNLSAIITGYGNRYADYPEHGKHAGIGKVMPQSLDEAIWSIGLLRSVRWVDDLLDPETRAAADRLAAGVVALLQPQIGTIHNIHCWMLAALAECSVRLQDDQLLAFSAHSEYGMAAQLEQGFRPEGLWWEVNPHYHYYTVQSALCWAEAAGRQVVTPDLAAVLARAVTAPVQLAYRDGLLPAYGDGWPQTWLPMFAAHAEAAAGLFPDQEIDLAPFYAGADAEPVKLWGGTPGSPGPSAALAGRNSVAALLFGPDDVAASGAAEPQSFHWPGAGIGVLQSNGLRITLRSGPDAGGHDHCDKLAVDIETPGGWRSLDLGTSGYGADFTNWMRSPAAHSTVFVGNQRQPHCDGEITEFTATRMQGSTGWDGCRLSRQLELVDAGWTDVFEIELDHEDDILWVLHGDGLISSEAPDAAEGSFTAAADDPLGRHYLRDPRPIDTSDGRLTFSWDVPGAPTVEVDLPADFTAVAAVGDGNPSGLPLGTMLVSGRSQHAVISARFRI